jgi:prepilin-type N-terminal cleavage/methylation domain-containing protein
MNARPHFERAEGFTLIEILMALFIGLVLLGAIYVSMNSGQKSSAGLERKVAAQQDVRAALEIMAMEIAMASFNPNFGSGIWRVPPPLSNACTGVSANQPYKGIQEATPTSISVEMDTGGAGPGRPSGAIGDSPNEIIRYTYDTANQRILRNPNCAGDLSFLGDVAGAAQGTRTVRVINNSIGIRNGKGEPAVFRYYDARNPPTELYPNAAPADYPNIRRIEITLGVETEEVDPSTQQRRSFIYSTSVLVKNHVLN